MGTPPNCRKMPKNGLANTEEKNKYANEMGFPQPFRIPSADGGVQN